MTALGMGRGRLTDVGPLIMGHRLATRETADAYSALIYGKGALVLRMLHMLLTDPGTGNCQPFFDMMSDFVRRHQNGAVSTDDFLAVANEHVARTPIAQKCGLTDLGWFFRQFVYDKVLPSYRLEYALEPQSDGTCFLKGTVFLEGVPEGQDWFMPLPVIVRLGGDRMGRTFAYAVGRENPFNLRLPNRPEEVELDPEAWVLSEKTSIRKT